MSLDNLIEQDSTLVKRGEIIVQVLFHRAMKGGLTLNVKAVPALEEMMKSLGSGVLEDVTNYNRYWSGKGPLQVYEMTTPALQGPIGQGRHTYRLDMPGYPLYDKANMGNCINLSFLRLAGISEMGVTFTVKGVHSLELVRDISDRVVECTRDFYTSFMKPADIAVMVQTQDLTA